MKNKTNQKGSITIFVLLACLFFIMFLMGMFMLGAVKRQVQIEATKQTQDIYSQGNANEIYSNYFDDGVVVPIYTKAQLDKMCSGEQISIKEEGGKIFTFSENSIYLLKEDITFEYNGIWQMPEFGETGRIEGNGKKITIKDTSKQEEFYYYYIGLNNYKEPLTEEDIIEPILLNKSTLDLEIENGVNVQETLLITKNVISGTVTWTSSNPTVATVDSNGKITTVGVGETTITVSCGGYSASCKVTVKEKVLRKISFTMDGKTYYAIEGWDWETWVVNSEYNILGLEFLTGNKTLGGFGSSLGTSYVSAAWYALIENSSRKLSRW